MSPQDLHIYSRWEELKDMEPYLAHIQRCGDQVETGEFTLNQGTSAVDIDLPGKEASLPKLMARSHWHDYMEVIYQTSGESVIILDGRSYSLLPGDMVFINTREVHLIYGYLGASYICLRFDPEILYTTARTSFEHRYLRPLGDLEFKPQQHFSSAEIHASGLDAIVWSAYREIMAKDFGYELAVRASLTNVYIWVLRRWKAMGMIRESESGLTDRQIAVLQRVFNFVESNYQHPITAQDAADVANMTYTYFSRFFKRAMGKSFTDYLTHFRLLEAEKRLMQSDDSVTDITTSVGFTSASYFIAQFRKAKGESPLQYRKKLMSISPSGEAESRIKAESK